MTWGVALAAQSPRIPGGYDPEPAGTQLSVRGPRAGGEGFRVDLTNNGPLTISSVRWVAILEEVGWKQPVRIVLSDEFRLSLAVGATMRLTSSWLSEPELDRAQAATERRLQIFFSPETIRYADGSEWKLKIADPQALNHRAALGFRP
jgi:hypothetical protein